MGKRRAVKREPIILTEEFFTIAEALTRGYTYSTKSKPTMVVDTPYRSWRLKPMTNEVIADAALRGIIVRGEIIALEKARKVSPVLDPLEESMIKKLAGTLRKNNKYVYGFSWRDIAAYILGANPKKGPNGLAQLVAYEVSRQKDVAADKESRLRNDGEEYVGTFLYVKRMHTQDRVLAKFKRFDVHWSQGFGFRIRQKEGRAHDIVFWSKLSSDTVFTVMQTTPSLTPLRCIVGRLPDSSLLYKSYDPEISEIACQIIDHYANSPLGKVTDEHA